MNTHNPRILCISPFCAPLANAEAFCGGKLLLHFLQSDVDFEVISVAYQSHPRFSYDSSELWLPLNPYIHAISPQASRSRVHSPFLGMRYLTSEWSRWVSAVVHRALDLHKRKPFDVVYSRSLPNIAHIAGYWVARAIGRPLVANFNDPWDLEATRLLPEHRQYRKLSLRWYMLDRWLIRVLREARAVTFPCERLRQYHHRIARPAGESAVIPHVGCSAEGMPPAAFELLHAGNLGVGETSRRGATVELLRALRDLFDQVPAAALYTKLVLVGAKDEATLRLAREIGVDSSIVCTGRVNYSQSIDYMRRSAACILIEGRMAEGVFLPSKFADYVQCGKPVIALSPQAGTIADLVPQQGLTRVSVDDRSSIRQAIRRHHDAFRTGRSEGLVPTSQLRDIFDGRRIVRDVLNVLSRAATSSPREPTI